MQYKSKLKLTESENKKIFDTYDEFIADLSGVIMDTMNLQIPEYNKLSFQRAISIEYLESQLDECNLKIFRDIQDMEMTMHQMEYVELLNFQHPAFDKPQLQ